MDDDGPRYRIIYADGFTTSCHWTWSELLVELRRALYFWRTRYRAVPRLRPARIERVPTPNERTTS